jgi:adenylate kinase family enzyme
MWEAKKWIVKNTRQPMIHLNGMPRAVEQLPILSFLAERGYKVKVIWFTTREDVCMNRPSRPGREVEDSPENRALRMRVYDEDTLPMQDYLPKYGISESNGNLLLIDNSDLEIAETGRQIINFLGLPVSVYHLFPKSAPTSMHEIEEFVEQRARAVA